jgi:hypothetical protein
LESQLLEHVPANKQPARPVPQNATAENDELAALQAAMGNGIVIRSLFDPFVQLSVYLMLVSWD